MPLLNMAEYCNHFVHPQLVLLSLLLAVSTHHRVEQVQGLLDEDVLADSYLWSEQLQNKKTGAITQATSNTSFLVQTSDLSTQTKSEQNWVRPMLCLPWWILWSSQWAEVLCRSTFNRLNLTKFTWLSTSVNRLPTPDWCRK